MVVSPRSLQDGSDMLAPVSLTFGSTVEAGGGWLRLWDARVSAVFCSGASTASRVKNNCRVEYAISPPPRGGKPQRVQRSMKRRTLPAGLGD